MADRVRLMGTCIHESGHAVVSYLLGAEISHVAVSGESTGEVTPECSLCRRCLQYYEQHDPAEYPHSQQIQDDLRRSVAITLAGELAESRLGEGDSVDEKDLRQDRFLSRERANAVNLWKRCGCYGRLKGEGECQECDALMAAVRGRVGEIIAKPGVSDAIVALAKHLADRRRLNGDEVSQFLAERGLRFGSVGEEDDLPAAPRK